MPSESIVTGLPDPIGRGEDPLYHFTRIYLAFLQGLFNQFPTGSYRWDPSENNTEIWIADQGPFPRDRIMQRPALITMRGPAQFANLSLDNMEKTDFHTGARRHTDIVACTMAINCVAKNGVEAQRLAWIVMSNIRRFKRLLQRNGIHKVGDEVNMGTESPPGSVITPESDSEAVMVTIQSPFYFQWTEEITPLNTPVLTNIEAHMTAQLGAALTTSTAQSDPRTTILRTPTIRGTPVGNSVPMDSHPIDVVIKT